MKKKEYQTENEFLSAIYNLGREYYEVNYVIKSLIEEKNEIIVAITELISDNGNGGYHKIFRDVMFMLFDRLATDPDRLDFVILKNDMDPGNFVDYCNQIGKEYHFEVIFFNDEINVYGAVFKPDLQVFDVLEEKYKIWRDQNLTEEEVKEN